MGVLLEMQGSVSESAKQPSVVVAVSWYCVQLLEVGRCVCTLSLVLYAPFTCVSICLSMCCCETEAMCMLLRLEAIMYFTSKCKATQHSIYA